MKHLRLVVDSYFYSLEKQRYSLYAGEEIIMNYHSDGRTSTLSLPYQHSATHWDIFTNEHCKINLKNPLTPQIIPYLYFSLDINCLKYLFRKRTRWSPCTKQVSLFHCAGVIGTPRKQDTTSNSIV